MKNAESEGFQRGSPEENRRAALLRVYRKRCLLVGTFGFGGLMSAMMFNSTLKIPNVTLPQPVLLATVGGICLLAGLVWGFLFYLLTRASFVKKNSA